MFSFKNYYYFYTDNIKTINLNLIKIKGKIRIIYRFKSYPKNLIELKKFRKKCKEKKISFFVANNYKLFVALKADGIYISAYNKSFKHLNYINRNIKIIGSAHNFREIYLKKNQSCSEIILSRLFKTEYINKKTYLGVVRFNLIKNLLNLKLIPLGGIRLTNLNLTNIVASNSLSFFSEIKKKPAIISRLF